MRIIYLGHSCFSIESNAGTKIVTDPYTKVGYELPKGIQADIVLVSHGHFDHNYMQAIEGNPVVFKEAGKYITKDIPIVGVDSWHDPKQGALRGHNVIFKFIVDGVTLCHFGDLGEAYSEELAEKIAGADVWLLPIGGTYTIDAAQALEYVKKLKPKAVIPMHYRPKDGCLDIAGAESFLSLVKDFSVISCKNGVYTLEKADLKVGETQIIYMERQK